jgi:hypothetical protein
MTEIYKIKPRDLIRQRRGPIPKELEEKQNKDRKIKRAIRKSLQASIKDPLQGKIIPAIAKETKIPTQVINWHLTSMRKYNIAYETPEREGQYYKWVLIPQDHQQGKKKKNKTENGKK